MYQRKNNGVVIPPNIRVGDPPRSEAGYNGKSLDDGQGDSGSVKIRYTGLVVCIAVAAAAVGIARHCYRRGFVVVANECGLWREDGGPREGMIGIGRGRPN